MNNSLLWGKVLPISIGPIQMLDQLRTHGGDQLLQIMCFTLKKFTCLAQRVQLNLDRVEAYFFKKNQPVQYENLGIGINSGHPVSCEKGK